MLILSFSSLNVDAATKEEALTAVMNFLKAQKSCNADGMIKNSQYFLKIDNLKESYTRFCSENPLQKAQITNLSVINDDLAFVSIQSTHKNMIHVRTSPVIKVDGQWKVVIGIPPSGVKGIKYSNKTERQDEIEQLFKDYNSAMRENNIAKMKTLIKVVPESSNEKIDEHLKMLSQQPTPQVTTYGINMVSESLAIAEIENKFPNHINTQNLAVYNENGQWKIIFGHLLTNSSIPRNGKTVDIK